MSETTRYMVLGRRKGKKKWFECHQHEDCLSSVNMKVVKFPDGTQGFTCHEEAQREADKVGSQHIRYEYRVVQLNNFGSKE